MERVQLKLVKSSPHTLVEKSGKSNPQKINVHVVRLRALIRIGEEDSPVLQDCIVDTGAMLSIFPEKEWNRFESRITWLEAESGVSLPGWRSALKGMTGGKVNCRPGYITVQLVDFNNQRLSIVRIVALFAQDGGQLKHILLGLDSGIFGGHRFELIYEEKPAWLYEHQIASP